MSPTDYDEADFLPPDYAAFTDDTPDQPEHDDPEPEPSNLPEPLPSLVSGGLTLRDLDEATKGLRAMLEQQLAQHVDLRRAERRQTLGDAQPGVADVAQLVRELADAGDVLDRIGRDILEAAKAARAHITDEALETGQDHITVPDGTTQIVVAPDEKNVYTFDAETLAGVLAHGATQEWGDDSTPERPTGPQAVPEGLDAEGSLRWAYRLGFVRGFAAVDDYGNTDWKVTTWTALRKRLMAAAEDPLAGAVERAVTKTRTKTGKIKVERKPFTPGGR